MLIIILENLPSKSLLLILLQAWSLYETNMLINLVDQDLDINISENEVKQVIFVALLCVQIDLTRRPMMSHVMAMLQGEMEIDIHLMEPGLRESNHELQSILDDV
jgi:hypothetical protein